MKFPRKEMNRTANSGAVLLLAMMFLLLMAMVAGTVMQTSTMEFRMAGNDQFREEAFQKAQGIAAAISADYVNFPVSGGVGYIVCLNNVVTTDCSQDLAALDSNIVSVPSGVNVDFKVERQGPAFLESLPFRLSQKKASSNLAYDAAVFETTVDVDGSTVGLGSAQVVQGVAVVIASAAQ